jgi:hypothetical protein
MQRYGDAAPTLRMLELCVRARCTTTSHPKRVSVRTMSRPVTRGALGILV